MNRKLLITACIFFLSCSARDVFAMEELDWWGGKLNGPPKISMKVQHGTLSLDISDYTGLEGEVRAPSVEITCSSDDMAKDSLLKILRFKADRFYFNGNLLEGACSPFSPQIAAPEHFTFLLTGKHQHPNPIPTLTPNTLCIEMKDFPQMVPSSFGVILNTLNESVESFKLVNHENMLLKEKYTYWTMSCPITLENEGKTYSFNIIDLHHAQYKEFGFLGSLGGDHPGRWETTRPKSTTEFKNRLKEFTNKYNEFFTKDGQYEVNKVCKNNIMWIRKNEKVKREAKKICIMFPDVMDNGRGLAFRFCRINDLALDPRDLAISFPAKFSGSYYEIQFHSKVKKPYAERDNGFNRIMPPEKFL